MQYLNKQAADTNSIVLIDRDTMQILSEVPCKKEELPSCLQCFEMRVSGQALSALSQAIGNTAGPSLGFVAVGTMFMDLNEEIPSNGRILIYEVQ